jgi:hypothetical protein
VQAVLRGGIVVDEPLGVVLDVLAAWRQVTLPDASGPTRFGEADLRQANRAGARISAGQIAVILERRPAIQRALRAIPLDATLAGEADAVPWDALRRLCDGFADVKGVGFSKMTKTLHWKRPALIPILDSVVQAYLAEDDPGAAVAYGERSLALVRGYQRDVARNHGVLAAARTDLAARGHQLTEVRILDLLIWSAQEAGRG